MAATLLDLVARGALDAELGAHLWLLAEGSTPLIVAGTLPLADRSATAAAILAAPPDRPWVVLDADEDPPTPERLSAVLRGDVHLGLVVEAPDLGGVMRRLSAPPDGLPEDGFRRLGVVIVLEPGDDGPRVQAAHYLRPTERDGQGHVQRRPPAVLATWLSDERRFEHFAWAITPELADRIDRSVPDYEHRHASRARLLDTLSRATDLDAATLSLRLADALSQERPREPARPPEAARPPAPNPLTDPHLH